MFKQGKLFRVVKIRYIYDNDLSLKLTIVFRIAPKITKTYFLKELQKNILLNYLTANFQSRQKNTTYNRYSMHSPQRYGVIYRHQ